MIRRLMTEGPGTGGAACAVATGPGGGGGATGGGVDSSQAESANTGRASSRAARRMGAEASPGSGDIGSNLCEIVPSMKLARLVRTAPLASLVLLAACGSTVTPAVPPAVDIPVPPAPKS